MFFAAIFQPCIRRLWHF